ncbi:Radical SAM domain protein [Cellulomonas flavigena DSM 20109]|uniref:Radical SAM domain protein n=1 Tax=Cellulomonas flavigena (strain ATCC 482 / DSM 20109 / BCRC 11376 / JCM 18109 / NBRC 3775 / NCIMB 8073 / NRS 134) TaxID=446466 RepID=D5UK66_CELFN|nr:radical SAM protein [Cellulomonas flavigena]ADG73808.1 Radical SAM domain protein [Cellulomonas flavigena DSM 20109]
MSPAGAAGDVVGPPGGRGILQIHPTRRCNLRCRHCYSRSGPDVDEALTTALVRSVVEDAAALGYGVLGVSGGEPLLHPGLGELLRTARGAGMRTTVTTNGMLLTPRRVDELAGWVDVLAISLDGAPDSHVAMRGDPRAFTRMAGRLEHLAASGTAFGFVFTLTQRNVHELDWVVRFAREVGAGLVHVHPLEPEGYALDNLPGAVPDVVELGFAAVEALRVSQEACGPALQIDVVSRRTLLSDPARFLALDAPPDGPLGSWLSPLVLETDGTVVPLTYGFPRRHALGDVHTARLVDLAAQWDAAPLLDVLRATHDRLTAPDGPPLTSWYTEVLTTARDRVEVGAGT